MGNHRSWLLASHKSRITNPLVTSSLLDRFYTWPGPPEDFLLVEPCERSTTIGAIQFPRLFAVATVLRLRGSTSGPGGEMSFPAELPTGAFPLIPYKFTRGNSSMISRARVHARARKGIADQGPSYITSHNERYGMTETIERIVLASRPVGEPTIDNFRSQKLPITQPGPGQMLLRRRRNFGAGSEAAIFTRNVA